MDKLGYLEDFIREQGLSKKDVCIVGSFALELAGLREAGDIDIVIKKTIRRAKGFDFRAATKVNEVVEVVRYGWAEFRGITDDALISEPDYSSEYKGYRVVKLDLLAEKKAVQGRPKDMVDIGLIRRERRVARGGWPAFREGVKKMFTRGRLMAEKRSTRVRSIVRRMKRGSYLSTLNAGRYELAISPENMISSEYVEGAFSRYDVIVRLLAVETYYGLNDFGFDLYKRMQAARGAAAGYEERFRSLIQRVEATSFDWKRGLDVTEDGYLLDGSHRLALALYHDVPVVTARIEWGRKGAVRYGMDWFKAGVFTDEECEWLRARKDQLFWERGLYFSVILWPPVAGKFEEIEGALGYPVVKSEDYIYGDADFERMVREIYEIDDIAEWKVCRKLSAMAAYAKKVRVLWVEFPDPEYRKKDLNNADISQVGERLKASIRGKYKGEVTNYIYDIICHTADNWGHNQKVMEVMGRQVDAKME